MPEHDWRYAGTAPYGDLYRCSRCPADPEVIDPGDPCPVDPDD